MQGKTKERPVSEGQTAAYAREMSLVPAIMVAIAAATVYPIFTYVPRLDDAEVRYEPQQSIMFLNGPPGAGQVPVVFTHVVPVSEHRAEKESERTNQRFDIRSLQRTETEPKNTPPARLLRK